MTGKLGGTKFDEPATETVEVPAQVQAVRVTVRGKEHVWPLFQDRALLDAMFLALINLEDEKIDSVLRSFGVEMKSHDGSAVFPPEED